MQVPDVMSLLIEAAKNAAPQAKKVEEDLLESDSRLIIVAGR